ncbi:MAG: IS66 family insertion sequence element accessory protein TnpB [Terriglobia bacterium]
MYAHVQTTLQQDPLSGHLFVFTNKLRNRIKVLYWDGSGLRRNPYHQTCPLVR